MSTERAGGDLPQIPPLVADLPLGKALPWKIIHRGGEWLGEVQAAESWQPGMGKAGEKGSRFRILFFTQPQDASPPEDTGIAFCLPGKLSYAQEKKAREYRAFKEERAGYRVKGEEERRLAGELIKEEAALYSQGRVLTRSPLTLIASEVFSLPTMKERLDLIASTLVAAWEIETWNSLLPYARLLAEGLKMASSLEEMETGEKVLLARLGEMGKQVEEMSRRLAALFSALGKPLEEARKSLGRLMHLAAAGSYIDFSSLARQEYPSPQALSDDLSLLLRLERVVAISPELVTVKSYLDKAEVGEGELALDRVSLLGQLELDNFLAHPHLWPHIKALFDWFRSRYSALYRAHHRRYHQELYSLYSRLEEAEAKVKALERLNSLAELGEPVGTRYCDEYKELLRLTSPCPQWDKDEVQLESHPLCPRCGLVLTSSSPQRRVENFLNGLEKALKEQHRRLSSEAVRQILARSKERRIDRFLKVLQASDLTPLVNVLDDELVEFLRELLAEGRLIPGAQREEPPPLTTL